MPKVNKCSFNKLWILDDALSWVRPVSTDPYSAFCTLCKVPIFLSNMGESALTSHKDGKKHKAMAINQKTTLPIYTALKISNNGSTTSSTEATTSKQSDENDPPTPILAFSALRSPDCITPASSHNSINRFSNKLNLNTYLVNDSATKAEILWCLHSVMRHSSLRDIESGLSMAKVIFPDSEIVKKVKLSKSKASYLIVYGLGRYFQDQLESLVKKCDILVVGFDESLNKISEKEQMDIAIRFWDVEKNEVSTRYLTSLFLGHTTAQDLMDAFTNNLPKDLLKKILQVSMDGPNVNLKFVKDLQIELKEISGNKKLLDLGTCGLHTLHGAFKTGITSTQWNLIPFLRALYNLFKNVPARRADYISASGSTLFPKKFCAIRWLENIPVVERARAILPHVRKYIEKCNKDKKVPKCNSYQIVTDSLGDKLLDVKLAFFQSFASEIEPFLREFQSNDPLAPFLYNAVASVLMTTMSRFVKPEVLKAYSLTKIDLEKADNLLFAKDINLGYTTNDAFRHTKLVKPVDISRFREECRKCLRIFVTKILQKSPLKFPIVKAISCFNPAIAIKNDLSCKRLSTALEIFVESNWISGIQANKIDREYKRIISLPTVQEKFKQFKRTERLDHFWMRLIELHGTESYTNLRDFTKKVMILSHGNAALERGFSINRECLLENQKEKSLIGQRVIHDAIVAQGNDLENLTVTKSMIHAARNAHAWYSEAVSKEKKEREEANKLHNEKKRTAAALKELESKKRKIFDNACKEAAQIKDEMAQLQRR
ncbi:uncharacterized protein LOC125501482 [Athalia rosae]|uniref:uncharacterized protein LOC125501360 n=1 Tax=Athalia rosae TaxID=37344 RepID=UPI002033D4DC|nr:uncharacterized protein LOC125501360 [Athalia rosae]XP_048513572.1 uncharacterized protein LOC125501482 [Athalia rosae]